MKKKTSRARRLFMTKNFILMLVLLVVIVMAISAWFTSRQTATASGINIETRNGAGIDIAPSIKTYDSNGNVLTDGPGEFQTTLTLGSSYTLVKDCTGDGISLLVPEFNITKDYESVRTHGGKDVNVNQSARNAVSDKYSAKQKELHPDQDAPEYQYIEEDFYARSTNTRLTLNPDSVLLSRTEANGSALSTALNVGDDRISAYGNFNVDGLVGAMRVALIGQPCTAVQQNWVTTTAPAGYVGTTTATLGSPEKQLLWVPRPDVRLNIPNTHGDVTNWTLSTGVTGGDTYKHSYYVNNGNSLNLVDPDTDDKTVVSSGTDIFNGVSAKCLGRIVNISDFASDNQPSLVSLVERSTDTTVRNTYYVTRFTLRIWIEGTDSEARRAMDGGQFKLVLKFS